MILWLLPSDMLGVMVCELSAPSEEILGPSETGDLIDSLLGCLLSETFIDNGMHFDRTKVSSLSAAKSYCLLLLRCKFVSNFQYGREQEQIPYLSTMFCQKMVPYYQEKDHISTSKSEDERVQLPSLGQRMNQFHVIAV